jgi:shikimate dehydrogenase
LTAVAALRRCVVIGRPIAHSRSPAIHQAFAEQVGIDLVYERLEAPADGFEATLAGLGAAGVAGCNVTLPFKFEAFALAARHSARAALAGACNSLRPLAEGGWEGDNTDGAGLLRDIEGNAGFALGGARVLLIGAGGAAAGVLGPLATSGASEVVVANRTVDRAERLVRAVRDQLGDGERPDAFHGRMARLCAAPLDACGERFDLVINATASSVAGAPVPIGAQALAPGALAVDLMYGPPARSFLDWARRHGATGRDGLGMLVEQAADAFAFFHGPRPLTAPVLASLRAEVDVR